MSDKNTGVDLLLALSHQSRRVKTETIDWLDTMTPAQFAPILARIVAEVAKENHPTSVDISHAIAEKLEDMANEARETRTGNAVLFALRNQYSFATSDTETWLEALDAHDFIPVLAKVLHEAFTGYLSHGERAGYIAAELGKSAKAAKGGDA